MVTPYEFILLVSGNSEKLFTETYILDGRNFNPANFPCVRMNTTEADYQITKVQDSNSGIAKDEHRTTIYFFSCLLLQKDIHWT